MADIILLVAVIAVACVSIGLIMGILLGSYLDRKEYTAGLKKVDD